MWRPSRHRPAEQAAGASRQRSAATKTPGRPRDAEAEERILESAMELLGVLGYNGMSIEAVAAQAGVGKTTVYRRWPCKGRLVVDALAKYICAEQVKLRPRSSLRENLRAYVGSVAAMMQTPVARNTMAGLAPDLVMKPDVAAAYQEGCVGPKRDSLQELLESAATRGEVPTGTQAGLATDILLGAIVWRSLFSDEPLDEEFCDALVDRVVAGLGCPTPTPGPQPPPAT
jgi:AcrR family transcriptional regulator